MSTKVKVVSIENGSFFTKINGELIEIKVGDILSKDSKIISGSGNSVNSKLYLQIDDAQIVVIAENSDLDDTIGSLIDSNRVKYEL